MVFSVPVKVAVLLSSSKVQVELVGSKVVGFAGAVSTSCSPVGNSVRFSVYVAVPAPDSFVNETVLFSVAEVMVVARSLAFNETVYVTFPSESVVLVTLVFAAVGSATRLAAVLMPVSLNSAVVEPSLPVV